MFRMDRSVVFLHRTGPRTGHASLFIVCSLRVISRCIFALHFLACLHRFIHQHSVMVVRLSSCIRIKLVWNTYSSGCGSACCAPPASHQETERHPGWTSSATHPAFFPIGSRCCGGGRGVEPMGEPRRGREKTETWRLQPLSWLLLSVNTALWKSKLVLEPEKICL